jgi:Putative Flp pilus-assembly TadE/G-like
MAMENKSIEVWLRNKIARFAVARDGNVAIIFGIAAMPLLLAVGATVDFSRRVRTKTSCKLRWHGGISLNVTAKSGYVIAYQFTYSGEGNFNFEAFGGVVPTGWVLATPVLVQ